MKPKHSFPLVLFVAALLVFTGAFAQHPLGKPATKHIQSKTQHRIVFQLVTNDTLAHKALIRQLGNILATDATAQLEVICHGPGLDMLHAQKSRVGSTIQRFKEKGVAFHACQFTLKEKNWSTEDLLPGTTTVPAGILALSERQMQGWSYIKAGF
jgi:intracellular sulfur oxidation DsrE/DsrF family protein